VGREDVVLVESAQRGVLTGLIQKGYLLPESERLIVEFQGKVTQLLTSSHLCCPFWLLPFRPQEQS